MVLRHTCCSASEALYTPSRRGRGRQQRRGPKGTQCCLLPGPQPVVAVVLLNSDGRIFMSSSFDWAINITWRSRVKRPRQQLPGSYRGFGRCSLQWRITKMLLQNLVIFIRMVSATGFGLRKHGTGFTLWCAPVALITEPLLFWKSMHDELIVNIHSPNGWLLVTSSSRAQRIFDTRSSAGTLRRPGSSRNGRTAIHIWTAETSICICRVWDAVWPTSDGWLSICTAWGDVIDLYFAFLCARWSGGYSFYADIHHVHMDAFLCKMRLKMPPLSLTPFSAHAQTHRRTEATALFEFLGNGLEKAWHTCVLTYGFFSLSMWPREAIPTKSYVSWQGCTFNGK